MSKEKKEGNFKIDYEHIDVADIMNQIKKKIAERPKEQLQEEFSTSPPQQQAMEYEVQEMVPGARGKIKRLLLKLMRPFSPIIKVLVLPVYEEVMKMDMRIDKRLKAVEEDLGKAMEYTKLLHTLSHNIVVELSKLKIEEDRLRIETRIIEKDFEFLSKREKALEKEVFK